MWDQIVVFRLVVMWARAECQNPLKIFESLQSLFAVQQDLADLSVTITAGPTREAIDPVRYISNHSSGKMGFAIAEAFTNVGQMSP